MKSLRENRWIGGFGGLFRIGAFEGLFRIGGFGGLFIIVATLSALSFASPLSLWNLPNKNI